MSLSESSSELSQGYMDQLRLPMLPIPFKQGASVDLTSPLAELIRTEFGEDPTQFRQEVREFNQLREVAIRPSRDNNGTSAVRRYYAQLSLLPTRFTATRSSMQVTFIWSDSFIDKEFANNMLHYETSAVLFNLGALHSRLGSDLPDELRAACTHFQCAAGAFYLLQTSLSSNIHVAIAPTQVDMSSEVVAFCKNLMLAQAQECMVEKSLLEKKRPSLVSKVAWEVSSLYQKAIDLLDTQMGQQVSKKNKNWQKILQSKFHIYQSVANYCQALSLEEESNYGHSIGHLQIATDNILAGSKVAKALQPALRNAVKYLTELIQAKAQSSVQTNQQVYHQLVPQSSELEDIHGAILVKPIEFSLSDKSVLGTDIFCKLVPMSILEGSSLYSEIQANLLRSVCESVQEKDRELGEFLSRIDIDEVLHHKDAKIHIPQEVASIRGQVLSEEGRMEGMEALLQSVLQTSNQIHGKLDAVSRHLQRDSVAPDNQTMEFLSQADKIEEYLQQGDKSNQELHQVMKELKAKLALLTASESTFLNSLPKLDLTAVEFDESAESKLHQLMEKVQEMQTQRATLEGQLRGDMAADDITSQLIASDTSREEVFEAGMKNHRETAALIRQNCLAQDNILKAITNVNAGLAGVRKELNAVKAEREGVYRGLLEAWKAMGSTEDSLKEGMKFYQNLDKKTIKLLETVKSVYPTPQMQQPIKSSETLLPSDTSYKPISPFTSPPGDTARPPVPSRRLKPPNETEELIFPGEDDTELALINWAASKQGNREVNNPKVSLSPARETNQDVSGLQLADQSNPVPKLAPVLPLPTVPAVQLTNQITAPEPIQHIPQMPVLATPTLDTSQLTQLIQTNQSDLSSALSCLQSGVSGAAQSVAELSLSMSAVVTHSSQSNAAISNLTQTAANQSASLEQLSSHLQTTNQNVVYTSQLVKLMEAALLSRMDSLEKSHQETAGRLSQLCEQLTQNQLAIVLKLDSLMDKISDSQSAHSQEVSSLNTALGDMREELQLIRSKQDSMVLAPVQSDARVSRDPLSFESRPMEAPSQVDQLWDMLGNKQEAVSSAGNAFQPSDHTAFSPIKHRPSSAFQLTAGQSAAPHASLGAPISIASANQIASNSNSHSVASLDPLSSLHTQTVPAVSLPSLPLLQHSQPSMPPQHPHSIPQMPAPLQQIQQTVPTHLTPIHSLQQTPAALYPTHHAIHPQTQLLAPQAIPPTTQYTPQIVQSNPQLPIHPAVQSNPQLPIHSAVQSNPQLPIHPSVQSNPQLPMHPAVQSNPQLPIHPAVQSNPHVPIHPAVQSNPHVPIHPAVQSNPQLPIHPAVQSNPQLPMHPAVQSNPQLPIHPAVQSTLPLNPQQHAYLQQLQKQLITSSPQSLTPDQLIAFQKQMLFLSQHPPQHPPQ